MVEFCEPQWHAAYGFQFVSDRLWPECARRSMLSAMARGGEGADVLVLDYIACALEYEPGAHSKRRARGRLVLVGRRD